MYSLWKSVLLWDLLCLFSSIAPEVASKSIDLHNTKESTQEGSCVTIGCDYIFQHEMELFWLKDPTWNNTERRFDGIVVYSNTKKRPQVSEYSNRVEFLNDQPKEYQKTACTIKIKDLKKKDSGLYAFRYINGNYKYKSDEFNLTVTDNPCKVHIEPPNVNKSFKEGDIVSFYCGTSATCHSHPIWQSSGSREVLSTVDRDNLLEKHSELKMNLSWTDHERILTCSPKNAEECLMRRITLSVEYVPKNIQIQESSSGIKLGFSLKLTCVTKANPLPNNYFWYFKPEGEQQFLALSHTNQEYSIGKVAVNNAGIYMCSAENIIGRGANSTGVNVFVFYPPQNLNLTMKQVVKEDELYTITCTVESSPRSTLTLNMSSLTNSREKELKKTDHQSNFLRFNATADVSHAGTYSCIAENTEGKSFLEKNLTVLYAPKNVTASAHPGKEVTEGSSLVLTCTADSVPQVSAYTWKKSGHHFGTHPVTVGNGQTITLSFLNSSDYYFCISKNEIGSTESSPIHIRVMYRPRITIFHNMTSLGLLENEFPVHLSCNAECDPPATFFAWYNLEENTTVLSDEQNYTVQPQNPGTYYCYARNEIGESRSEPVKIYLNHFIIKRLIQVIIFILVIIFLIGVILLLQRLFMRKSSSGKNKRTFIFSAGPLRSLSGLRFPGSHNNIRENLVIEGSTDFSIYRDNHSAAAVHSNPPANRPNSDIHTVYDAIKFPPSMSKHHHTKEDSAMTSVNYGMQFKDSNNQNKSVQSSVIYCPVYAKVSKKKQKAEEQQGGHGDYENVSGVCAPKQPYPNIDWDSDSSESEDEVKYTQVLFTTASHDNPQKDTFISNEEEKTEYSEVKV